MIQPITVYPVGSWVTLDDDVPGVIVAVTLRGIRNDVCYMIEWWDGREMKSREFDAFRVSPGQKGVQPVTIGFKAEAS